MMPESKPPTDNSDSTELDVIEKDLDAGESLPEKLKNLASSFRREIEYERKLTRILKTIIFLLILGIVVVADILLLVDVQNWSLPIVVGILELIALAIIAKTLEIDLVAELIDKFVSGFGGRNQNAPPDQ